MRLPRILGRFGRDERGVAAVEMALVGGILLGALLNVVEVGRYAYLSTQVAAASQAGAHAAFARCDARSTPVTLHCEELEDEVTSAIRGTSVGGRIRLRGEFEEGWYCVNETGALERMADAEDRPATCTDAGDSEATPGLYLRVQTELPYEPIFPGLTVAEAFSDTIVKTAWMRLL